MSERVRSPERHLPEVRNWPDRPRQDLPPRRYEQLYGPSGYRRARPSSSSSSSSSSSLALAQGRDSASDSFSMGLVALEQLLDVRAGGKRHGSPSPAFSSRTGRFAQPKDTMTTFATMSSAACSAEDLTTDHHQRSQQQRGSSQSRGSHQSFFKPPREVIQTLRQEEASRSAPEKGLRKLRRERKRAGGHMTSSFLAQRRGDSWTRAEEERMRRAKEKVIHDLLLPPKIREPVALIRKKSAPKIDWRVEREKESMKKWSGRKGPCKILPEDIIRERDRNLQTILHQMRRAEREEKKRESERWKLGEYLKLEDEIDYLIQRRSPSVSGPFRSKTPRFREELPRSELESSASVGPGTYQLPPSFSVKEPEKPSHMFQSRVARGMKERPSREPSTPRGSAIEIKNPGRLSPAFQASAPTHIVFDDFDLYGNLDFLL